MWCRATCEPFRFSYSGGERKFRHMAKGKGTKAKLNESTYLIEGAMAGDAVDRITPKLLEQG